jgi:pyruvate formate-lyase activating enzyme-like uncharacterized protein
MIFQRGGGMKIIPIQEAYRRKFERQRQIAGLQYHASGHCVHIGRISPGCYSCFVPDTYHNNILTGAECNLNCVYCFKKMEQEEEKSDRLRKAANWMMDSMRPEYNPRSISFSGGGEPLLYMEMLATWMTFFQGLARDTGKRPWYYLYTNGLLATEETIMRLQDMGFDEIRFHLGASNFSQEVYGNLAKAVRYFKAVTVETPSWPLHRKQLFEMLPIIHDLGVKHLNLGEIEITAFNRDKIARALPEAEIYHCFEMHLDDGGLTYDLMEEVLAKKYAYSVLDCNCFVKSYQRAPGKHVAHEDPVDLVADY